jgi:hypothetical protein
MTWALSRDQIGGTTVNCRPTKCRPTKCRPTKCLML